MRKCYQKYVEAKILKQKMKILDLGGANVNGTYSELFSYNVEYIGADLEPHPGVSLVLDEPNKIPLPDNSIDLVLSGQMLEHCANFWLVFSEMVRVVKEDGYIFLIAPSKGPIHRYPVDCYRFYPDAYEALASYTKCHLIECWRDQRGPWYDLVGVFNKTGDTSVPEKIEPPLLVPISNTNSAKEIVKGETPYIDVLTRLHRRLEPKNYLEIGVRHGKSIVLANCHAIGVDPQPELKVQLPSSTSIVTSTSDLFFEKKKEIFHKEPVDFAFIDGMHLFEYVLRDFMNIERFCGPQSVVVIDDIYPNTPAQATRNRETQVWTGDVWKFYRCLKEYRPDLCLVPIDTSPTGLLIITGMQPDNRILWKQYNSIVSCVDGMAEVPPKEILNRTNAISAVGIWFKKYLNTLSRRRKGNLPLKPARQQLSELAYATARTQPKLKLSVVVVSFNMNRELPRTIRTLAESYQKGINAFEYEIIIVDNGSKKRPTAEFYRRFASNITILNCTSGSVSPAQAMNMGIRKAKGEIIGAFIDGARMASPGLLRTAIDVIQQNANAVVGTIAFHLGHSVQMESVHEGYNRATENALLETVPWKKDGYALYDISVFAGSSRHGWFQLPNESNAFFMHQNLWKQIGYFEEAFQSKGGGLVNLDMWRRACTFKDSDIIMLLGETTFHQFHGGIATNSSKPPMQQFMNEYKKIRSKPFTPPDEPYTLRISKYADFDKILSVSVEKRQHTLPGDSLSVQHRKFRSSLPSTHLNDIQNGVMKSVYRDVPFFKSPFDIAIYLQLLAKQKTRSVIEIGTKHGGSALWFADMLSAMHKERPTVISVDIDPISRVRDDRITFLRGDAAKLDDVLDDTVIEQLPRPLLVIEDSSHFYEHTLATLKYFHPRLKSGDYIVVEDGIVSQLPHPQYRQYQDGPNRAVIDFLEKHSDAYTLDTALCDFFGHNVTYNPNGFLQKK
ncbi:MAG: class I SAM-dependent methyltransferase [Deltaproteobacteria bacterium]|nr:class I SAM-dependent methyltransferase [Deltaproteobacteria bacterium]MBN2673146.1 class I SAM-dependent methyltransferase [Deltaproteobacteria bacterium]